MHFDPRINLHHDDPRFRGHAAVMLRQSLDERDGDMLVSALIKETDGPSFAWMCDIVMCKWMVKLERALYRSDTWPIADNCTMWFVIKAEGWEYPSYERFLPQHLDGDSWLYKFAAFLYCRQKLRCLGRMQRVCEELLTKLDDKSIDWGAVAASANLKSKRVIRTKIARIASEWELLTPKSLVSVTHSSTGVASISIRHIHNAENSALPGDSASREVTDTIKITSVHMTDEVEHQHIVSVRWTNIQTDESGEISSESLVAWLQTPGHRAVVVDGLSLVDVHIVDAEPRHIQANENEAWQPSLLYLPRY